MMGTCPDSDPKGSSGLYISRSLSENRESRIRLRGGRLADAQLIRGYIYVINPTYEDKLTGYKMNYLR